MGMLVSGSFPTLGEILDENDEGSNDEAKAKAKTKKKAKKHQQTRQTYFCIGVSQFWKVPLHAIINKIKAKYGLSWLRISMSHHRFTNLRETLQVDLTGKIMHGTESKDFMKEPCNCHGKKLAIATATTAADKE